jgi:outer membrane immunogenic protein
MLLKRVVLPTLAISLFFLSSQNTIAAENKFSGPYIGLGISYLDAKDDGWEYYDGDKSTYSQNPKPEGIGVNINAGYNWNIINNTILGLEMGYTQYNGVKDHSAQYNHDENDKYCDKNASTYCTFQTNIKQNGSLITKIGFTGIDKTQIYVLGGYTISQIKRTFKDGETLKDNKWQDGWVAGLGVEYLTNSNFSMKLEYKYSDLGSHSYINDWGKEKFELTQHEALLGFNFKF